ncbi:putative endomembrane protein 70 [Piptocephalis cylindrospora]|uniref:Transmembrane 9 superfamily member n=1 Tax=Piptocephalis cylindrospora TaxID=1907219 RepID=A0A4P9XYH0_9FUNG|nr:putative endomembrane protein 70 [Piptocephalis cylindrospora]|eukprot:RKP11437.1 putative endomembrane protein 70 [Piptocephalis cylindrospora]
MGPTIALSGILPFGAIFIELYFILSSIWSQKVYYVFGFLFLVSMILALTVGQVSVLMCYFQLCAENYRWWWRSFLAGGSVGLYVFAYSVLYYYTRLDLEDFSSKVLYFGWMGIMSLMVFLATGNIGFGACCWFTRRIYKSIKVD